MEKLYNEEDSRKTELRRLRSKRECITQGHLKVEAFREALLLYLVCWYVLVVQLCLTLCAPRDCSMPGFPVLHHLPEFAQTLVH